LLPLILIADRTVYYVLYSIVRTNLCLQFPWSAWVLLIHSFERLEQPAC